MLPYVLARWVVAGSPFVDSVVLRSSPSSGIFVGLHFPLEVVTYAFDGGGEETWYCLNGRTVVGTWQKVFVAETLSA